MVENGSAEFALRKDRQLSQIHWATTRREQVESLFAFAFDHRSQFIDMAQASGRSPEDIGRFKSIALQAVETVAGQYDGVGLLVDDRLGREALHAAADLGVWIGRPIEESGTFPMTFEEGPDLGSRLAEWPVNHCVKVLAPLRIDDPQDIIDYHEKELVRLADACRGTGHELLLEIINSRMDKPVDPEQIITLMQRLYALGVMPDWWKLEPVADPDFWCRAGNVVRAHDPHVQGIIVLGKEASAEALVETFAAARSEKLVRGFAIGRTIFGAPARKWFDGEIDDAAAHDMMAATYSQLIEAWNNAAHQPVNMAGVAT